MTDNDTYDRINRLINIFEKNVIIQNDAIWKDADAKKGNKAAKKYIAAYREIREIGDEAREEFSRLLDHENPDVRSSAAAFLLRYCTDRAMKVLKEVSKMEGIVGFEASQAIQRWEDGEWELDPE